MVHDPYEHWDIYPTKKAQKTDYVTPVLMIIAAIALAAVYCFKQVNHIKTN